MFYIYLYQFYFLLFLLEEGHFLNKQNTNSVFPSLEN